MTGGRSGRYLTTTFSKQMRPCCGQLSGGLLSSTIAAASELMGLYSIMRSTQFMLTSISALIRTSQFIRPAHPTLVIAAWCEQRGLSRMQSALWMDCPQIRCFCGLQERGWGALISEMKPTWYKHSALRSRACLQAFTSKRGGSQSQLKVHAIP